jgi:hypothetical protein
MATEQQERRIGLIVLIGVLALAVLAFAAANSGIPWLEAWFDGGANGSMSAQASDEGDLAGTGDGGETAAEGNGCFLGFICLNAAVNADGNVLNVTANDDGVSADNE